MIGRTCDEPGRRADRAAAGPHGLPRHPDADADGRPAADRRDALLPDLPGLPRRGRVPGGPGPRDVCAMPAGTPGGRDPAPGLVRPSSARRWDGGHDWSGRYEAPVWARIAGALLERGLDVEDGVRSLFRRVTTTGSPYPNQLLSAEALDAYEREEMPGIIRQRHVNRRVMDQLLPWRSAMRCRCTATRSSRPPGSPSSGSRPTPSSRSSGTGSWPNSIRESRVPGDSGGLSCAGAVTYAASVRAYDEAYDHPVAGEFPNGRRDDEAGAGGPGGGRPGRVGRRAGRDGRLPGLNRARGRAVSRSAAGKVSNVGRTGRPVPAAENSACGGSTPAPDSSPAGRRPTRRGDPPRRRPARQAPRSP